MIEVWTLVLISLMFNGEYHEPTVGGYWTYDTMTECFDAWDSLGSELSGVQGAFPKGTQAICIPRVVGEPT